jgi:hypothetical protein
MNNSFDVFLSHNSKNKPAVRELAEALRGRGLKVWLDEWELVPGRPWQEALEEVIETTGSSAVLVGRDGIGPWQDAEMRGCLSEFVDRSLPVIPVLLPGAPDIPRLPLFLKRFTWVDLRGGLTEEGLDRLQWGVTGKRPDRSKPPSAPSAASEAVDANKAALAKALSTLDKERLVPEIEAPAAVPPPTRKKRPPNAKNSHGNKGRRTLTRQDVLQSPTPRSQPRRYREHNTAVARSIELQGKTVKIYVLCLAIMIAAVSAIVSWPNGERPREPPIVPEGPALAPRDSLEYELPTYDPYDPGNRRDPFRTLLAAPDFLGGQGKRPEGVPGLLIDEIIVTGIFRTSKGFVAQVADKDLKRSYLLKEGDQLYDGDVVSVSVNEVVFKQTVQDPSALKPFREVVKSPR